MLYEQIKRNKRKTVILVTVFIIIVLLVSALVGKMIEDDYTYGLIGGSIFGSIYITIVLATSRKMTLMANNAIEADKTQYKMLYNIVEDMAMVADIPTPKVYVIEDNSYNAFATGFSPQNSAVAVTTGLLSIMNREELEAVIGHEISHIRNYDIRIATIALALSGILSWICYFGRSFLYSRENRRKVNKVALCLFVFAMILAPFLSMVLQFAISRQREFQADAGSVYLTRNPKGMINALKKLKESAPLERDISEANAMLYIRNPKKKMSFLFATHPPIDLRIERLEKM